MPYKCPLCKDNSEKEVSFHQKLHKRDIVKCPNCFLFFVPREQLVNLDVEKSRYESHNNSERSQGYEKFLRRLIEPISERFKKDSKGLDYGEGPYPMLLEIMRDDGFSNIKGYDPFFNPNEEVLTEKYEFVTMCEVIEHVSDLDFELNRLNELLVEKGVLVISSAIKEEVIDFKTWYYILDDTHINFLTHETVKWIELNYPFKLIETKKDLFIFSKI